jgi:hypothetical protein
MPIVSALVDPVREFFTLSRAEKVVRSHVPADQARATSYLAGAQARAWAARRALHALPAAVLLREALVLYLRAKQVLAGLDDSRPLTQEGLAELLGPVPAEAASPRAAAAADDERVRSALVASDPLHLDRLAPDEIERTRWALDRACTAASKGVEVRSLVHLWGLRWGRRLGVLLLVGYTGIAWARATFGPIDVALGKPVHASSRRPGTPDGHELVDGDVGTSFGIHTNTEDEPHIVIDLQGDFTVDKVVVYNRVDGWFDDSLPLVVEVSVDGVHYDEVGRREQHFDADPPWVLPAQGRVAHFVRLRVARHSYLTLSEVEVIGRPKNKK